MNQYFENKKIRLAIADDHELFRSQMILLLNSNPDLEVVVQSKDGQELLQQLQTGIHVDILLLDINMPGKTGLELLPILLQKYLNLKVIMLSMNSHAGIVKAALQTGASYYLQKDIEPNDLTETIRCTMNSCRILPTIGNC